MKRRVGVIGFLGMAAIAAILIAGACDRESGAWQAPAGGMTPRAGANLVESARVGRVAARGAGGRAEPTAAAADANDLAPSGCFGRPPLTAPALWPPAC